MERIHSERAKREEEDRIRIEEERIKAEEIARREAIRVKVVEEEKLLKKQM